MGKIHKASSARQEPSSFVKEFIKHGIAQDWASLPKYLATFPRDWPFPRGDLNHWIELLNRFDEILDAFVKEYELSSGPQTVAFRRHILLRKQDPSTDSSHVLLEQLGYPQDGDRLLVESILLFSALLFDNCSNRSLYRSSDRLGCILNTSSISLLHANLQLCLRLAKRFYATRTRQNNSSSMLPQLLKDQFDVNLDHLLKLALPFSRLRTAQVGTKASGKGKERASSYDDQCTINPSDLVGFLKAENNDNSLTDWLSIDYTIHIAPATTVLDTPASISAPSAPASPSIRRSNTATSKDDLFLTNSKTISVTANQLKSPAWEVFANKCEGVPVESQYDLMHRIRIAKAMQRSDWRQTLVSIRLHAVAILAFVHGDHTFQQKVTLSIAEEPRAFQLPHQLSELLQPVEPSGLQVPVSLQTAAITTLEALCMQKSINGDVYSSLSANVSHGVLFYIIRLAVEQLRHTEVVDETGSHSNLYEEEDWRDAIFELLRTIPSAAARGAENLFAAGILDILNEILKLRTSKASRTHHKVIAFLDNFVHTVRESMAAYVSSNGLDIIADLVAFTVNEASERVEQNQGLPDKYKSRVAEYQIPYHNQSTLKMCLKFLNHMMAHQNGNLNRHLRVLFDSRVFIASLNKVLASPYVYGSALWSGVLNFMSAFLNNEPTSYSVVAESQLNDSFLKILGTRLELPPLAHSGLRNIEEWVKRPQKAILPATDAMTAFPAAISALCLNEAGLKQFQEPDLFSNFFEIFESPAHLQVMESESMDIPVALGRAFDELVRHHPSRENGLKSPITSAIIKLAKRVKHRAIAEAEQYGFGAKLFLNSMSRDPEKDKHFVVFVAGGKTSLRGDNPSALITEQNNDASSDVDMVDASDSVDSAMTVDVLAKNRGGPTPVAMIFNTLRFIAAFCSNTATRQSFMDMGGINLILDLITSPALPIIHQPGDPSMNSPVSKLLQYMVEERPFIVIPAILGRISTKLDFVKPMYENKTSQMFFVSFTKWTEDPERPFQPLNQAVSGVGKLAEGTNYVKALLEIRILTEGLATVFQNQMYNHRNQTSLFVSANCADLYVDVFERLAKLQSSCAWEEIQMMLESSTPKAIIDGPRSSRGRITGHLLFAEDILADLDLDVPARSAISATGSSITTEEQQGTATSSTIVVTPVPAADKRHPITQLNEAGGSATPNNSDLVKDSAQFKNTLVLRSIFQEIMLAVGSFISSINRVLISRRGQDVYARQYASNVAQQIAASAIDQLKFTPARESNNTEYHLAYLLVMLSNAYNLFVDENSTSPQTLTLFIMSFKQQNGFVVLEEMLDELIAAPEFGTKREQSTTATSSISASVNETYISGAIKLILLIYGPVVIAKHVTDSPQTTALTSASRGHPRESPDYFSAAQFIVEMRFFAASPLMKLWHLSKGDKPEIIREQIDILRPILEADSEDGAFTRDDKIVIRTKPAPKLWRPKSAELLTSLGNEYGRDLALEALFRCFDNAANARLYCQAYMSGRKEFKRNPIPLKELRTVLDTQANPPIPSREDPTNSDETVSQINEEEDADVDAEEMDTSDSEDAGDSLADEGNSEFEENLIVLLSPIKPPTIEDLEHTRSKLRDGLVDRCLDLLQNNEGLSFELRDLITAACKSKAFLAQEGVGSTILFSLVSLESDEFDNTQAAENHFKKVAGYSLFLGLILQQKEFYESAKEDLIENLDSLLKLMKHYPMVENAAYGNATSHILLILELLFQDDLSPMKVTWHAPAETDAIFEPPKLLNIEKPILESAQRLAIFETILDVMPHVGDNTKLALAVSRALVALTRQRELAVLLSEKKNLQRLFSMIKQIKGASDVTMQHNLLLILRHIIEDDAVIRQIMRSEIQTIFEARSRQQFETLTYCRNMAYLVLRSPQNFLQVSQEMVKITKYDPRHPSQMLALKQDKPEAAQMENKSVLEAANKEEAAGDSMEMSIAGLVQPDLDKAKQLELKMPVNDNSDGLIHFMLTELLNYKDVEDTDPVATTPKDKEQSSDATASVMASNGPTPATSMSHLDILNRYNFFDDKTKAKDAFKPEHHRIFLYRCFLLQSLAELLASYTKAKVDFVNFRRRIDPAGATPSKPRSLVLQYFFQSLIPTGTVIHKDDVAFKKKEGTSQWSIQVLSGLCAKTFEKPYVKSGASESDASFDLSRYEEEPELLYVRRYVLEHSLKAFKETVSSSEPLDMKYSKLLKLSDFYYKLLTQNSQASAVSSSYLDLVAVSKKMLAKIMYEKNFIATLTSAISEIDLAHPGAKRVTKYILRPLKTLADLANDLSIGSVIPGASGVAEEEEFQSDSDDSDFDGAREETPDLFRNSSLGILAGGGESDSDSEDAMEEDEMYDEYMEGDDYDEEMEYDDEDMEHDPEEILSDEDEDMTGLSGPDDDVQIAIEGAVESSLSGEDDDSEDEDDDSDDSDDDDEDDSDDEDIEDESGEIDADEWATESPEEAEEDEEGEEDEEDHVHPEFVALPPIVQQLQQLERGINMNMLEGMSDPPDYDSPNFQGLMDFGQHGSHGHELDMDEAGDMDEGEEDYLDYNDEDILYEPEVDEEDEMDMPEGTIGIRSGGHMIPLIEYAHRHHGHHGHAHIHGHHRPIGSNHLHHRHMPPGLTRPRQDDGSNPLLQRHGPPVSQPHRHEYGGPEAIIGSLEQFIDGSRPFPPADTPHQQMSFLNSIMNLFQQGGATHMLPAHGAHAVRVQINHNAEMMFLRNRYARHSMPPPIGGARDDPLLVHSFSISSTSGRWQEETRILFGALAADKATLLVSALHQLLVPAARQAQMEEEAKRKRLEQEAAEKARKEQEKREAAEKLEREEAEKTAREQKAIADAVQAAAEAEAAIEQAELEHDTGGRRTDGTPDGPEADEDRMSGVEAPTTEHISQAGETLVAANTPHVPVMRTLNGRQVDIAALGIDAEYFDAIPPEMQQEIFMVQAVNQRAEAEPTGSDAEEFDAEFLAALPEEMRNEIIDTTRRERRRRDREADRRRAAASVPGGRVAQAEEMDIPSFLATLENGDLRRQILMEADEHVLRQLPADLIAEARALGYRGGGARESVLRGMPEGYPGFPRTASGRHEQPHRIRRPQQYVQILDKANVATLLRLLFLQQSGSLKSSFNDVLSSICQNRQNRAEVVSIILQVLQDIGNELSTDKTLAHLVSRAKSGASIKTPQSKQGPVDSFQHTELSPAMVAKNCLDTLASLSANHKVVDFFLTEHETSSAFKLKSSRKGKAKDTKASRYPINALLSLLDRKLITENAALMENLAVLLQSLAAPLAIMAKKKQEEEQEKKATGSMTATIAEPENDTTTSGPAAMADSALIEARTSAVDGAQPLNDAATIPATEGDTKKAGAFSAPQETKKPRGMTEPPEITDSNLRLVINIIAARECSSRAFQKTLTLITHLSSAVPNAMNIFGEELIRQAQELGRNILHDLRDLLLQINKATSGHEVQGVAIAKFSPASSDQTKLLRVITALGYIFDPKRTFAAAYDNQSARNDKILLSLYENETFSPMWENLSLCLTAIHERGNMMNVATILLPLIEVLMVVCQNASQEFVLPSATTENHGMVSSPAAESMETSTSMGTLFFKFTDSHKKILNELVRSSPKLMSGSFSVLVRNSKVLEFDNKRNYFQRKLHTKESQNGQRQTFPSLQVNVRRDTTFLDSFRQLSFKKPDEFKFGKLNVRFQGEEGVDAGGLTREWFQVLVQQIFNPNYALFNPMASDRLTYHPNPQSSINEVHLSYFSFVGRVIGKAMYESRPLDCHFSRAVYKRMLGQQVVMRDMEAHDPTYFASLKYILENSIADGAMGDFTFSAENEVFGELIIDDLVENGRNILVTDENKREYVRLIVEHKLVTSIKDQLDHFLKGFHEIIPADMVSIFTEKELELLISGLPDIDVDDWKNNTEYSGYTPSSPQIVWFWRMVRSFDKEQQAKLLQFVTGTSKVPLNGFKELEGMNGFSRFAIHRDFSNDRLPSAHTCFNQLDLPEYDSYEKLRDTLLLAITDGSGEFGFA